MINTGSGAFDLLLILIVFGIMAAGYYFLVVVPSREPDVEPEDEWDREDREDPER